jgi:hypothetical protein
MSAGETMMRFTNWLQRQINEIERKIDQHPGAVEGATDGQLQEYRKLIVLQRFLQSQLETTAAARSMVSRRFRFSPAA